MEDFVSIEKPLVVLGCIYLSWKIVKHIWSFMDVEKEPVTILVTGAAGMPRFYIFSSNFITFFNSILDYDYFLFINLHFL